MLTGKILGEDEPAGWCGGHVDYARGCEDYADRGWWGKFCGGEEDGDEELGEEKMAQTIDPHHCFMTLDRYGACRGTRTSRIIPKHIETGFLGQERRNSWWDGGEIVEVEDERFDCSWVGGGRRCFDFLNCSGDSRGGARGDVDGATGRVENLDEGETDAGVSAGDNKDFTGEGSDVIFGVSWFWRKELIHNGPHDLLINN